MDALWVQSSFQNDFYYNAFKFTDPTQAGQPINCAACFTNNSSQVGNGHDGKDAVLGIYGVPTNLFTAMPLLVAFGNTNTTTSPWQSGSRVYQLDDTGHISTGGTVNPGVSACGTGSPAITGKDSAFVITLGTGTPTACTVTFGSTWLSTDLTCTFISESDLVNWKFVKVGSANAWTGITLTSSAALTNASKIHGVCVGHV